MITLLTTGFTIPYNPFDMTKVVPFLNDLTEKVSLGATVGFLGFIAITGFLVVFAAIKGLFR